ncbi:MAG: adenylate cyclase [Solirubrobacteraceae bacterium]|nr:adenylate cyclase [Solirubrobacteraceae bacterium]
MALNEARAWALIVDRDWRYVYMTDDMRLSVGRPPRMIAVPLGLHYFGSETAKSEMYQRVFRPETSGRHALAGLGPWLLADTRGGRVELRDVLDATHRDLIDAIEPDDRLIVRSFPMPAYTVGGALAELLVTAWRVRDAGGRLAGTVIQTIPTAGMTMLGTLATAGDAGHFARMQSVAKAGRRPAAILFADLEASSPLARRLSTASYFALGRRLTRAADQCVVDAGGLVGRHVGDGVVAFFLAMNAGSESAAARACISAARALRTAVADVAARSDLQPEEIVLRFGLHWGSTLYVGQIATSGRSEVTALGDEVNEAARIEACATGGRALASKDLIERLEDDDAAALDLHPDRITYTALGDLSTATEKARRDAPAIAVCDVLGHDRRR